MPTFKLVNPKIIGDFSDTISAQNEADAADKTWLKITKYTTKNLPKFLFTLENTQSGKLHNFAVDESPDGKIANYDISEFDSNLTNSQVKSFKNELARLERKTKHLTRGTQEGGRRHKHHRYDDDDSSTSESDDLYDQIRLIKSINSPQPIVYWWYTPMLYTTYKIPNIYIPTFNPPLLPYVEINLSSAWLG
jgi:hypothetical protein